MTTPQVFFYSTIQYLLLGTKFSRYRYLIHVRLRVLNNGNGNRKFGFGLVKERSTRVPSLAEVLRVTRDRTMALITCHDPACMVCETLSEFSLDSRITAALMVGDVGTPGLFRKVLYEGYAWLYGGYMRQCHQWL